MASTRADSSAFRLRCGRAIVLVLMRRADPVAPPPADLPVASVELVVPVR